MATYTLNLGFNWDSPQIGTLFAETTLDVRFLQFALYDSSGNPASFTEFNGGDSITLMVYALTGSAVFQALVEQNPSATLSFAFGPVATGGTLAAYDPSTLVVTDDPGMQTLWTTPPGKTAQRYLQFTSTAQDAGGSSPWGTALYTWTFADLTFLTGEDNPIFEMGMSLAVPTPGQQNVSRQYVGDPEVIVGSGSTPTN